MYKLKTVAVFAIIMAVLAINAFAFSGGTGESTDPYTISTLNDLKELATSSQTDSFEGKYFLQTAAIEVPENESVSIGKKDLPFAGKYDGHGYAISGLKTNGALFAFVKDAEIKNVKVENAVITVAEYSAGIVGKATGTTTITDCNFTGTFEDAALNALLSYVGGICANAGEQTVITGCKADVTANLTKALYLFYIGGIAGENNGKIAECESKGTVAVVSDNYILAVGGIAGKNKGTVEGSKNLASVSGNIKTGAARLYLGGIVGENNGSIERTENKGTVSCTGYEEYPAYTGGVVGYNVNGTVAESKNTGAVEAGVSYVGGVLGLNIATEGKAEVSDTLNSGAVTSTNGIAGGVAGGSVAMEGENESSISSSLNTEAMTNGDAAIGSVTTRADATSTISNIVVNGASEHATGMTTEQLKTATEISSLASEAWLYPMDGFLPQLATVKNLEETEVIALSIDKSTDKVAFCVYNSGAKTTARAIISCYQGTRFIGTRITTVEIEAGYSVFTLESAYVSDADNASVMLLDATTKYAPMADKSDF